MDNIKKFKFKIIKNFLTKNELNIFENYCKIRHRLNDSEFTNDILTWDTSIYGDPLMESLLLNKKTKMEELTGLSLLPTYAFWRMYTKYAVLEKHSDRPSCEISATLNIGSDGTPWPIYMDGNAVETNPGDAVIYLGCELPHWREEFMGDWCAQTFLHYVDANGPYTNHEKDKRKLWGNKEGQRQ